MLLLIEFINDCAERFVSSTGLMLIQSSILILILWSLDRLLRKRLRAVFRYGLWMLVLIKLVLPSNLSLPFSASYWMSSVKQHIVRVGPNPGPALDMDRVDRALRDDVQPPLTLVASPPVGLAQSAADSEQAIIQSPIKTMAKTNADSAPQRSQSLTWQGLLFSLWLGVCLLAGLIVLHKTLLLQTIVRQASPASQHLETVFKTCCERIALIPRVKLRTSSVIPTPAVCGLFRPTVIMPKHILERNMEPQELEVIFTHELVHIQRGDLWVKLLQTILQVVYFYHPLVWLANATIRKVRELAVDEEVRVILGQSDAEVYPSTLLKVAGWVLDQPRLGLRLIGVMESNDLLRERINTMLHKPTPHSRTMSRIGLVVLFVLGLFLLPMAQADRLVPQSSTETNAEVDKDIDRIEALKQELAALQQMLETTQQAMKLKQAELEDLRQVLNAKIRPHADDTIVQLPSRVPREGATVGDAVESVEPVSVPTNSFRRRSTASQNSRRGGVVQTSKSNVTSSGTLSLQPETLDIQPVQPNDGMMMEAVPPGESVSMPSDPTMSMAIAPKRGRGRATSSVSQFGTSRSSSRGRSTTSSPYYSYGDELSRRTTPGGRQPGSALDRDGQPIGKSESFPILDRAGRRKNISENTLDLQQPSSALDRLAFRKDISEEVKKELQVLLPELLKEILPTLLKEAQSSSADQAPAALSF